MKAKLVVEGKEFDIEILNPKLQELITPKKKTGYERVESFEEFFANYHCETTTYTDKRMNFSNKCYDCADYYSDKTVAENNNRADKLMRQLRRFAVEHRVNSLNWDNDTQAKWMIYHGSDGLGVCESDNIPCFGTIYFDRILDADEAIEAFKDELIWYFTEYRDSL